MIKSTQPTFENTLVLPVGFFNMSAFAASLTGVSCININNTNSFSRSFVCKKFFELKERPLINLLPLSLSQCFLTLFSLFFGKFSRSTTNTSQFFKNYCVSTLKSTYNLLRNAMVGVTHETVLLLFNFLKVSLCVMSFGLQLTSKFLIFSFNVPKSFPIKETIIGTHRRSFNPTINSNKFPIWSNIFHFFFKTNIEKNLTFANKQIGRSSLPSKVLFEILRNIKLKFHSTINGKNRNDTLVHPNIVGVSIKPNAALFGLRAFFTLQHFDRTKSFCCFHSCGDRKLRWQRLPCFLVGKFVKVNTISSFLKSSFADLIVRVCVSINCWLQLACRNVQSYFNGAYQSHILHLYSNEISIFENYFKEAGFLPAMQ